MIPIDECVSELDELSPIEIIDEDECEDVCEDDGRYMENEVISESVELIPIEIIDEDEFMDECMIEDIVTEDDGRYIGDDNNDQDGMEVNVYVLNVQNFLD